MTGSIKRVSICFVLAIALAFTMMPLTAQPASAAASIDKGSLQKGVATEINFGPDSDYSMYDNSYFFKVKPTKTGIITVSGNTVWPMGGYVALCDANKKLISKESKDSYGAYLSTSSSSKYMTNVKFGVKKGKTYYIRIQKCIVINKNDAGDYIATLKWTNTAVKNIKYGKTKKKALKIKRNKAKYGVIKAGSRKAQWYKFTTKKKSFYVGFNGRNSNGTLYAVVYYKNYGKWYTYKMYSGRGFSTDKAQGSKNKAIKSTYYIKVYPKYKSSGSYKLVWK